MKTLLVMIAAALLLAQPAAPPQTRQVSANGVNLTYVDEGKGTPVVFVHGALSDLRFWEPQRQAFASTYRFIAYTYRYHGTEPWPDVGTSYSGATHLADLVAFLKGMKAEPVHLVGLSYGGSLAALAAASHPELLRSVTLAEPGLFSLIVEKPEAKPALDAFVKGFQEVATVLKAGDHKGALRQFYALVTGTSPDAYDKLPPAGQQMFEENSRTLPLLFSGQLPPITCEALGKVKVPTLVVEGARTPVFFREVDKAVVSCIPGSRLVMIPDASHPMSAENPAAFNEAVLEFLAKR